MMYYVAKKYLDGMEIVDCKLTMPQAKLAAEKCVEYSAGSASVVILKEVAVLRAVPVPTIKWEDIT